MEQFLSKAFTGGPFVLFSPSHLCAIGAILLLITWVVSLRKNPNEVLKRRFRVTVAVVIIINELLWHIWNWAVGQWTVQTMLPLHLCSIFVYMSAVIMVTKNEKLRQAAFPFMYFLGIAGATQAILTPDLGIYDFPHFRYYQTFISHGLIVVTPIYMAVVEGFRPTWGSMPKVMLWSNVYMVLVGLVNWLVGSNYMFIAHKPPTASLIDMLGPWPFYLLSLEAIGLVLFVLLYLPYAIKDFIDSRRMISKTAVN